MKILFLTSVCPFDEITGPGAGGAERAIKVIAEDMARLGNEVHFLSINQVRAPEKPINGVRLHLVPAIETRGARFPMNLLISTLVLINKFFIAIDRHVLSWTPESFVLPPITSVKRLISRLNYRFWNFQLIIQKICRDHDIEHIHCYTSLPDSLATAIAAQKLNISFSMRMGGRFWFTKLEKIVNDIARLRYFKELKFIFNRVAGITYNSKFIFQDSQLKYQQLKMAPKGIAQILDIGLKLQTPVPLPKTLWTNKPESILKLACVGTFKNGSKRQDLVLKALATMKGSSFHVYFAGGGPLLKEAQELASNLEILDHVTFLGTIPQSQVVDLLNHCSAFILPTEFEGASKALAEAMMLGKFVIASNIPANSEYVKHLTTGYLVENSVEDFAQAFQWLIRSPEKVPTISEQAQRFAHNHFDPDINAQKYFQFFESLKH